MYSTCLFCRAPLGKNEMLEHFPVGRRIAFDAARGRLWVVCPSCRQWSLSPLDERWEAVEEAERLYRGTRLRVATDQIGLARLKDGSELVRIGAPLRPEFAAWRYGDRFSARWRKRLAWGVAGGTALTAYIVAGPVMGLFATGGMWIPWNLAQFGNNALYTRRVIARIPIRLGTIVMTEQHARAVRILANLAEGTEWRVSLPHQRADVDVGRLTKPSKETDPRIELTGEPAVQALRELLPRINRGGGRRRTVADAVQLMETSGSTDALFADVTVGMRARLAERATIAQFDAPVRLALEMAVHEETERRALEGELAALEAAWRDAEEVAAIADQLTLPERVATRLERLRG